MIGNLISYLIGVAFWLAIALYFENTAVTVVAAAVITVLTLFLVRVIREHIAGLKGPRQ